MATDREQTRQDLPAAIGVAVRSRRRPAVSPSVIAGLAIVALLGAARAAQVELGSGQWLWNLDLPKIDYPLASFFHDALAQGRLPLWNNQLGLGFPLYAEGQIGAFYPPNWLLFQLPPLTALDATRVFHLTLAGVGAGMLVLRLSGSRGGAVVAVLVAVLGGAITAKLEWQNLVAAYGWAPWVLLPLVRRPAPTRVGLVTSGVLFGIQALAGHPNTWLLTGITAAAILLARPPRRAGLARVIGFGLLGVCVGAVQLVPTALLTTLSVRGTALTPDDLFAAAATPFDVIGTGFQGAFARLSEGHWDIYTTWYPDGIFAQLEAAAYVGLPVVALAAVAIGARRVRPLVLAIAVLIAIPVIEAFRPEILLSVPFVNGLRSPVRAYLLATLLLGVVAGVSLARPHRAWPPRSWPSRRAGVAVGIPTVAYVVALGLAVALPAVFDRVLAAFTTFGSLDDAAAHRPLAIDALTAPWPLLAELLMGASILLLLAAAAFRPRVRASIAVVAPVIVAVPLVLFGPAPNGTRPADAFSFAQSEFLQAVAASHPHRFVTIDAPGYFAGMPDQPAAAGIADLHMFSSLNLRASDDVAELAARDEPDATQLRRVLGVDVVATFGAPCPGEPVATVSEPASEVCRDPAALRPPYWIPADVAKVAGGPGSPIRPREAVLDPGAALTTAIDVLPTARDATALDLRVDSPTDGWVWVDESWWPGWWATLDGSAVETLRAQGGTLIAVPAGSHELSMRLVPWDALLGLALGIIALVVAIGWLYRSERRARDAVPPSTDRPSGVPRSAVPPSTDPPSTDRHFTVPPSTDPPSAVPQSAAAR